MILCFYNFFMFFSVIAFVSQCLHKCPTELWHRCRIFYDLHLRYRHALILTLACLLMYKLWCIFLMQLFNFTPLKRYDLCAGALALTLGGGPEVGVLRDCFAVMSRNNQQMRENIEDVRHWELFF